MKKLFSIISALFLGFCTLDAQTQDSTATQQFASVKEYLDYIVFLPVDSINMKVDSLISSLEPKGIDIQSTAAGLAFDYFNTAPVMGVEGVSVHIANKYFIDGPLVWKDSASMFTLRNFVEMNKSSLLGCRGEDFTMESIDGSPVTLSKLNSSYKIIYFYEPGCSSCSDETKRLITLLSKYKATDITLIAVNISRDRDEWEQYAADNFSTLSNNKVTVLNLWDPELSSSYQMKYGVIKTPMMFLLDSQDIIIGRKLNAAALSRLLAVSIRDKADYSKFFENLFRQAQPECTEDVNTITDALVKKTERDSTLFREVVSNLFDYLRNYQFRYMQDGATYVAERYIVGEPWYWTERYVDKIFHMLEMNRLNPLETKATNLLLQDRHGKYTTLHKECESLSCAYTLVLFHLISCKECEETIEHLVAIKRDLANAGIKVVLVYSGHDEELWNQFVKEHPRGWTYLRDKTGESRMHELYDLEFVPHMYLLDEYKIIVAKDISVKSLETIIQYL